MLEELSPEMQQAFKEAIGQTDEPKKEQPDENQEVVEDQPEEEIEEEVVSEEPGTEEEEVEEEEVAEEEEEEEGDTQPKGGRKSRVEKRINKLVGELKGMSEKLSERDNAIMQLQQQLMAVQTQTVQAQKEEPKDEWAAATQQQLIAVATSDSEDITQEQKARAMTELLTRQEKSTTSQKSEAEELAKVQLEGFKAAADELKDIASKDADFDAFNQNSPVMLKAKEIYAEEAKRDSAFLSNPNNERWALTKASEALLREKYLEKKEAASKQAAKKAKTVRTASSQATSRAAVNTTNPKQITEDIVSGKLSLHEALKKGHLG